MFSLGFRRFQERSLERMGKVPLEPCVDRPLKSPQKPHAISRAPEAAPPLARAASGGEAKPSSRVAFQRPRKTQLGEKLVTHLEFAVSFGFPLNKPEIGTLKSKQTNIVGQKKAELTESLMKIPTNKSLLIEWIARKESNIVIYHLPLKRSSLKVSSPETQEVRQNAKAWQLTGKGHLWSISRS